jgi:hypothetical protein
VSTPAPGGTVPRVSAVVVSYNTRDDLLPCLEALLAQTDVFLDVIVVDNASTDGSVEAVRGRHPEVRLIVNTANLGFSRANNLGLRAARGPYVLVVNSDCEVRPGAVETLCAILEARPDVAIVGPRTVGTDGAPQVSFGPSLTPLAEWRQGRLVRAVKAGDAAALRRARARADHEQEPDWVSASCFLARGEAWRRSAASTSPSSSMKRTSISASASGGRGGASSIPRRPRSCTTWAGAWTGPPRSPGWSTTAATCVSTPSTTRRRIGSRSARGWPDGRPGAGCARERDRPAASGARKSARS